MTNSATTVSPPGFDALPDEVVEVVRLYADNSSNNKRLFAFAMLDYYNEITHGYRARAVELIADEWNRVSGENVAPRTVRYWLDSVITYKRHELQRFANLADSMLIEAVKLADACQNDITPQEICEHAVKAGLENVAQMRAHWLPQTGTVYVVDPPFIAAVKRGITRFIPQDTQQYKEAVELVEKLAVLVREFVK